MNDTLKHIFAKMSSGRWLLTVMLGVTFCILSIKEVIPSADFIKAFLVIIYAYFTKNETHK